MRRYPQASERASYTVDQSEFSDLIVIVLEHEKAADEANDGLWRIGDALIQACGPPGQRGVNTGTNNILAEVGRELKRHCHREYSPVYLSKLRQVAAAFTDDNRLSSVPWTIHLAAGDPVTLNTARKKAEAEGANLTASFVKKVASQLRYERQESERLKYPELTGRPGPDAAFQIAKRDFMKLAADAAACANAAEKLAAPFLLGLSKEEVEALHAAATSVAVPWADLAENIKMGAAQSAEAAQ